MTTPVSSSSSSSSSGTPSEDENMINRYRDLIQALQKRGERDKLDAMWKELKASLPTKLLKALSQELAANNR